MDTYQPGDVIAFRADDVLGDLICIATRGNVSHVGVILEGGEDPKDVVFIDSTSIDGQEGVRIYSLAERLAGYNGCIWHLPLADRLRRRMRVDVFQRFLKKQEGKDYDTAGAGFCGLDDLLANTGRISPECFDEFFCSELVAAGLEKAGVLPAVNCSSITPVELCAYNIYQPTYRTLLGEDEIKDFNCRPIGRTAGFGISQ